MKIKRIPVILIAVLFVCAALFIQSAPVSAAVEEITPEQGLLLQYPPPYPPYPPTPPPPPPTPPVIYTKPYTRPCPNPCPPNPCPDPCPPKPCPAPCPVTKPCPPSPPSWDCNDYNDCYDCTPTKVVIIQKVQKQVVCDPVINSFVANPGCIEPCQDVVLSWNVSNATSVTISPGIGSVSKSSGSYHVSPGSTTTYVLTASNSSGSASASTTVTVTPYTSSVTTTTIGTTQVATAGTVATAGVGSGFLDINLGDGPFNSWPLYVLVVVLLGAIVAAVIILLSRRSPAMAYAGVRTGTGTRAGFVSWDTSMQAATDTPRTTPIANGSGAGFVAPNGERLSLTGDVTVLGRSDFRSTAMPGNASLISREHIRIEQEHGEYYIEDVNSTNGTRVNGSRITGKGRFLLSDGDRIELADAVTITFRS